MTLNIEPGVPMPGTLQIVFIPADTEGLNLPALTKAQVTDEDNVIVQCHILGGTYTGITTNVPQIRKTRACSKDPYYVDGEKEVDTGSIQVVYDPQDLTSDLSTPYAELVPGTHWVRVESRGIDGQEELDSGDIVDVTLVKITHRNKPYSEEAGSEHYVDIFMSYQGETHEDIVIDDPGT